MPYSGSVFSNLFNWLTDAIRNPKIQDARLDAEFDDIAAALSTFSGKFNISQTGSGSLGATSPTDFGYPYDHIQITSDGYDASGFAAGKQVTTALLIDQYPNNNSKGNHNGLTAACWVPPGATVDTSTNWGYCGALLFGKSDINLGGTNTGAGAKGAVFGANPYATLGASATNAYGCVACEADVLTLAGSSVKLRVGVSSVDLGSAVQGASVDSAYTVGALAGSIGWKAGLTFTDMNGGAPLSTTGKLITTSGTATVDYGVDISGYTISTSAFKSTGFNVDGSGNTTITSTSASALAVGRLGATNPVFVVKASQPSVATGIRVVGDAAGSGAGIEVISSGTDDLLAINSKGSADTFINNTATGAVRIGNALLPKTDDSAALGSTVVRWADLFLSTGAVINYNNGNYTVTHSSGVLTFSKTIAINQDPTTGPAINTENNAGVTVTNGGNSSLLTLGASGFLIIAGGANMAYPTACYLVGSGLITHFIGGDTRFVAPTTTPAAGKVSVSYDGAAGNRIYSGLTGGTGSEVFKIMFIKLQ